jgi:hypothetical protein
MQPTRYRLEPRLAFTSHMPLTASNARTPRFWVSWAGSCSRTHAVRNPDANDCAASLVNLCVSSTARNAAPGALRSAVVRPGNSRAACHAGSPFTTRLRPMNTPSTALYTRVPVKNRVRISRHCAGFGRSGHDRTWVGAPLGRLRARGLRSTVCSGPPAGVGSMRYPLPVSTPQR